MALVPASAEAFRDSVEEMGIQLRVAQDNAAAGEWRRAQDRLKALIAEATTALQIATRAEAEPRYDPETADRLANNPREHGGS